MVVTKSFELHTRGNGEVIDFTEQAAQAVAESGIKAGIIALFVPGSTAAITTIENESGLLNDFKELWERIASQRLPYRHNERWGDGNGHSHLRASLLGASLVVPIIEGRMALGTWQQTVLVDFDNRPRERRIIMQIMG